jgi:TPR repeat protein
MYDMFSNSCKYGTSFRTCDTAEYLHYTILEKEKKGESKLNIKIHNNIDDLLKTRLNYFENKCKNEKDGFACEQMVSYSGEEGKAQLDYARKSCEYGNRTGCELLAEILVTNNNEKEALVYYKKACDLGEGRACVSTIMMMMPNHNKHEKDIQEYGKKTIETKFCLPSVNPQFFVATSPEESYNYFKQGCETCNDASACFSYATLHLDQLSTKNVSQSRKFEAEEEVPRILMKACGHASLLSNPFLIEPCLSVYLHSTNAFPTNY